MARAVAPSSHQGVFDKVSARLTLALPAFAPTVASDLRSRFEPALRLCAAIYRRAPGYVVAAGLSLFLLVSVAVFSGRRSGISEEALRKSGALLTETSSLPSANAQPDVSLPMAGALEDADTPQQSASAPTAPSFADAGMSEQEAKGASERTASESKQTAVRRKRVRRQAREKSRRLIRNLDF